MGRQSKLLATCLSVSLGLLCSTGIAACGEDEDEDGDDGDFDGDDQDETGDLDAGVGDDAGLDAGDGGPGGFSCDPADNPIELPEGFCATPFGNDLGKIRHIAVTPSGDVFVALTSVPEEEGDPKVGGIIALRDDDNDGVSDAVEDFGGDEGGNGIFWHDGQLFFATDGEVLRYEMPDGQLLPTGDPVTVVSGLPDDLDHPAKSIVVHDGKLYVNHGSASNACQEANREVGSDGVDPCPELEIRAGIWVFDATATDQTMEDGERFATGARNFNALSVHPENGTLWGAQNGRDQLYDNWPELYTEEQEQTLPNEVLHQIDEGDDFGWPYCYYDAERGGHVLAPEYGGDGEEVGRCAGIEAPAAVYPAHWAPLGQAFYMGTLFPEKYRGGLFIANHGSRFAPEATGDLPGYNVIFQPFAEGVPGGEYEVFASGFAGDERPLPDEAEHRPVGVAAAADGTLYITDDQNGYIWRVTYVGE
jgi:glucose/arabinose dehydrogenase